LLVAVCLVSIPAEAHYSGGSGTPEDPYQIATAEDLVNLGETPEDYDKHFILTADIDLDPNLPGRRVFDRAVIAPDVNDEENGWQGTAFTGVFDGNGHTISHLTTTGGSDLGLFGKLSLKAAVSNLGLEALDVTGEWRVGGLVGQNETGSSITSCYSTGTVNGSHWMGVGGLVGKNYGSITRSHSTGTITAVGPVGGLVGSNWGSITASNSGGIVVGECGSGFWPAGGLVGENAGSITSSYSTATVTGCDLVGGLVGNNYIAPGIGGLTHPGSIAMSYSSGVVSGVGYNVGGLVGNNGNGSITTSYSTAMVNGDEGVGGLVGHNGGGKINASYSTGAVSGESYVGGLVGSNSCYGLCGQITDSYWDIETSGEPNMCGYQKEGSTGCDPDYGKTTAEMKQQSTFEDWDFVNAWGIGENQTYPYLRKYSAADINQDESVDFADLAILGDNWLADISP
jgi:hypothetical protein